MRSAAELRRCEHSGVRSSPFIRSELHRQLRAELNTPPGHLDRCLGQKRINGGRHGRSLHSPTVARPLPRRAWPVNGRHGRSTPEGQDNQLAAIEREATATATIIAGLRWRLRRQETIEHPKVRAELRRLEEQVTAQLAPSEEAAGRHRAPGDQAISPHIADAAGYDLKPNPLTATTTAEYLEALRKYRAWSGDPSWRAMAKRAGHAVVHSTMYAAMNGDTLPKLDVVRAIIIGCGGGEDDLTVFVTAWRRIATGRIQRPSVDVRFLSTLA